MPFFKRLRSPSKRSTGYFLSLQVKLLCSGFLVKTELEKWKQIVFADQELAFSGQHWLDE